MIFFEEMFFELTSLPALNMRHILFMINAIRFIYVHVLSWCFPPEVAIKFTDQDKQFGVQDAQNIMSLNQLTLYVNIITYNSHSH